MSHTYHFEKLHFLSPVPCGPKGEHRSQMIDVTCLLNGPELRFIREDGRHVVVPQSICIGVLSESPPPAAKHSDPRQTELPLETPAVEPARPAPAPKSVTKTPTKGFKGRRK